MDKINYWFYLEPYVYVNIKKNSLLLYNTLDGAFLKIKNENIIGLFKELLKKENMGVVLLEYDFFNRIEIKTLIQDIRKKYMGDIINLSLVKSKPIQILPYFNYININKPSFNYELVENLLCFLSEISIFIDNSTDIIKLSNVVDEFSDNLSFNIFGEWEKTSDINYLVQKISLKKDCVINVFSSNFEFPNLKIKDIVNHKLIVDLQKIVPKSKRKKFFSKYLDKSVQFIFEIRNVDDFLESHSLIADLEIVNYQFKPVFTGDNLDFFKEFVFLEEKDILSVKNSMKDIFQKKFINVNDFGKIIIKSNGDVFANEYHPCLGNIYTDTIFDIVKNEFENGKSWLRIRDFIPCSDCLFCDLCPSPSNYELEIGIPNLCYINE